MKHPLATPEGTAAYARAHPAAPGHYRAWRGLTLSSLGFGSYLGEDTDDADAAYTAAFEVGLRGGVNVLDTAANYRGRRSEHAVGAALGAAPREQFLLATKGGFVASPAALHSYLGAGVITPGDVAMGCHSIAPGYLAGELERSLEVLGVDAVDVYFLHNPEAQLDAFPRPVVMQRLRDAIGFLEGARKAGRIGCYGLATWFALRVPPAHRSHLALEDVLDIARDVGGTQHGLRAVELPYSLAMPEAARAATQPWRGESVPALQVAREADLLVLGSATLMQGQLLRRMPDPVRERLGASPAEAAIQFSRSTPGVTTALVGTGRPEHARLNLSIVGQEPRPGVAASLLGG